MSPGALVLVDSLVWATVSVAVGFAASKVPASAFRHDVWLTRIRAVEREGRAYERLRIRSWKDSLPDAGRTFGGLSKRRLPDTRAQGLATFAAETRRAEVVHWLLLAAGPLFLLWNPLGLSLAMLAYAVVSNVPCIAIQRYNRARILRIQQRRARRIRR